MTALPGVNTLVRVALDEKSMLLPSRIEAVVGDELVITAPSYVGKLDALAVGQIVSVYWTAARGVCSLPAQFVAEERRISKVWRLRPAGVMEVVQRRRYSRVECAGAVSLVDNGVDVVRVGWMMDLGEGGLRCRLAPGSFRSNHPVECRLTLDGELIVVAGTVLRSEVASNGSAELIVTFDDDNPMSDRVRRFVFAQQLLGRRMAPHS